MRKDLYFIRKACDAWQIISGGCKIWSVARKGVIVNCDRMKKWFVKCGSDPCATDDIPAPLLEGARWCLDGCTRVAPIILNLDFLFGIWRCGDC